MAQQDQETMPAASGWAPCLTQRTYCTTGKLVLSNAIDTTWYCDIKVVVLTSKFGIVGIDYEI